MYTKIVCIGLEYAHSCIQIFVYICSYSYRISCIYFKIILDNSDINIIMVRGNNHVIDTDLKKLFKFFKFM